MPRDLYVKGQLNIETDPFIRIKEVFETSTRKDPEFVELFFNLGLVSFELEENLRRSPLLRKSLNYGLNLQIPISI